MSEDDRPLEVRKLLKKLGYEVSDEIPQNKVSDFYMVSASPFSSNSVGSGTNTITFQAFVESGTGTTTCSVTAFDWANYAIKPIP